MRLTLRPRWSPIRRCRRELCILTSECVNTDSHGVADENLFLSFAVQRVKTSPSSYPYHRTFPSGIYISKPHLRNKRT
ncbi:hypothetical protein BDN70DRAFT_888370 [Pholiota conissans]|uniref:Uncharacterized protein n=1 Tax=Pholiota conissans TaxID=109636 RepID=A0A9P5YK02_9AGAR|nr:hypothetical protein BDN70DRAFT_888370 [Pholiota conissans]